MAYQPPFTITTDILNLVAQISQQVGELNASQLNASVNAPLKEGKHAPVNTLINVTGLKCIFRSNPDTDSGITRTVIPR